MCGDLLVAFKDAKGYSLVLYDDGEVELISPDEPQEVFRGAQFDPTGDWLAPAVRWANDILATLPNKAAGWALYGDGSAARLDFERCNGYWVTAPDAADAFRRANVAILGGKLLKNRWGPSADPAAYVAEGWAQISDVCLAQPAPPRRDGAMTLVNGKGRLIFVTRISTTEVHVIGHSFDTPWEVVVFVPRITDDEGCLWAAIKAARGRE